ncbi:hypothetical protein KXW38_002348, partial [Aspergillus fumigatus]
GSAACVGSGGRQLIDLRGNRSPAGESPSSSTIRPRRSRQSALAHPEPSSARCNGSTAARAAGADVIVSTFPDPIGRDAVVQWPGGVNLQLYWHTTKPDYAPFERVPENRVYVSPDRAAAFTRSFLAFSRGKIVSDDAKAP